MFRKRNAISIAIPALVLAAATWTHAEALVPATVQVADITSEEAPIYQHLWKIAQAAVAGDGTPVPIVFEAMQSLHTFAYEEPNRTEPGGPSVHSTHATFVLNPQYPSFLFGESSLLGRGLTGEVNLGVVVDALIEASPAPFIWRYDARNRVINVTEKALSDAPQWPLNQEIAGLPLTATDPIEALNALAQIAGAGRIRPEHPAAKALAAKTDGIEVEGETVRDALNSILTHTSDVYRYYHIHPVPEIDYGRDLADWLNSEDPRWHITWPAAGYSSVLEEEKRRVESGKRYTVPGIGRKE